jgi:hypothetical protein
MNTTTLLLESLSFILALWQNHLLAHKKRHAWWLYFIFSVVTVCLFYLKDSYITVINQTYLWITALYPWIYWNSRNNNFQKSLNNIGWLFLIFSLYLFRLHDIWDWFEVASWFCIYMKNNLTRTDNATGWIYMIAQKVITVIFNIIRVNYILALRNVIQLWQAVYGYKQWKAK